MNVLYHILPASASPYRGVLSRQIIGVPLTYFPSGLWYGPEYRTSMPQSMFFAAGAFNQGLSGWDVSQVTTMKVCYRAWRTPRHGMH